MLKLANSIRSACVQTSSVSGNNSRHAALAQSLDLRLTTLSETSRHFNTVNMSSNHQPLDTSALSDSHACRKLCNGSTVEYSHPDFGTVFLPLQYSISAEQGLQEQSSWADINKHPLWLAELLAGSIHDAFPEIPSHDWNWFAYHFLTVSSLSNYQHYNFIDAAWATLQSFFEGYYYQPWSYSIAFNHSIQGPRQDNLSSFAICHLS